MNPVCLPRAEQTIPYDSQETVGATCHDPGVTALRSVVLDKSWLHFIAGGLGGMTAALVTSPLDVIKTRLQSDFYRTQHYAGRATSTPQSLSFLRSSLLHFHEMFQILLSIRQVEGWRSLFKGLGPNLQWQALNFPYANGGKETAWVHLLAAATAGIAMSTATNPIWLVKTRLQLDRSLAEKAGGKTGRKYKNSFDCVRQVLRDEGVRGLYRGLSASYLGVTESTLHWILYEQVKLQLSQRKERLLRDGHKVGMQDDLLDWGGRVGGAGSSKLLAALITYPHEVVRTRLRQAPTENGQLKYTGIIQGFRLIWQQEGLVSLYGGLTLHLRTVPSTAIIFGVYELVMNIFDTQS